MKKFLRIFAELNDDKSGASFIEYTVLLGVILAVSIATIGTVGGYASDIWGTLEGTMGIAAG